MSLIVGATLALGLVGHCLLAIGYVNRLHGLPIRPPWFKILEAPVFLWTVLAPLAAAWSVSTGQLDRWWQGTVAAGDGPGTTLVFGYFAITATAFVMGFPFWLRDRLRGTPAALLADEGRLLDIAARVDRPLAGNAATRRWARLPGNQVFSLDVREKELELDRLPAALQGLSITHLSDIHLSGRIGVEFYEQMVDEANALSGDVIAVTGDLFDNVACFDWLPRTLARLRAPLGIYFVLGNHDWRMPDPSEVRRRLVDLDWIDLGGRSRLVTWREERVRLAGNECPWFAPAPRWDVSSGESSHQVKDREFVVALLHTPDQIGWARRQDVDLALAGHTHGGQIRLPLLGALVAPSLHGVKYAGGVFHEGRTVMHVSRGASGLEPVRWNCPPEITRLTLRPAAPPSSRR